MSLPDENENDQSLGSHVTHTVAHVYASTDFYTPKYWTTLFKLIVYRSMMSHCVFSQCIYNAHVVLH